MGAGDPAGAAAGAGGGRSLSTPAPDSAGTPLSPQRLTRPHGAGGVDLVRAYGVASQIGVAAAGGDSPAGDGGLPSAATDGGGGGALWRAPAPAGEGGPPLVTDAALQTGWDGSHGIPRRLIRGPEPASWQGMPANSPSATELQWAVPCNAGSLRPIPGAGRRTRRQRAWDPGGHTPRDATLSKRYWA